MMANIIRFGGGSVTPTEPPYPDGAIYWEGEEFVSKTGGWDANVYTNGVLTSNGIYQLTKNTSNFYGALTNYYQAKYRGTVNKIDLTDLATLKAKIIHTTAQYAEVHFFVQSVNQGNPYGSYNGTTPVAQTIVNTSLNGIVSLDVSALSGTYYVFITLSNAAMSGGAGATLTVEKIWGEL